MTTFPPPTVLKTALEVTVSVTVPMLCGNAENTVIVDASAVYEYAVGETATKTVSETKKVDVTVIFLVIKG